MSRDLTEELRKLQKSHKKQESIREKATRILSRQRTRTEWPKTKVFVPFLNLPKEQLYDQLVEYRLSLDPVTMKEEIAALKTITNTLPWPFVPQLLKYMNSVGSDTFKVPLAAFMKASAVSKTIKKSILFLKKRQADASFEVQLPAALTQSKQFQESYNVSLNECVNEYKSANWVPIVVDKDVKVMEMVSRNRRGTEVKPGWYKLSDTWYENACRFGRVFVADKYGYLLSDGLVLVENLELFNAATNYFRYSNKSSNCLLEYLNAPWLDFSVKVGVFMMVARDTESTHDWIGPEVVGSPGWFRLKDEWVKRVCERGRMFIPGDIGYLLNDGSVLPETRAIHSLATAYVNRMNKKEPDSGMLSCQFSGTLAPWVKRGGRSAIGMVAEKTPETLDWIVPTPIPGTKWFMLKKSWYSQVCKSARTWQPGVFGYRFANGEIEVENEQMFKDYLVWRSKRMSRVPLPKHLTAAKKLLRQILPENDVELLLSDFVDTDDLQNFLDTVSRISVFGSKLLNIPQVHLDRLARGQYDMRVLPLLTPVQMLPEIYADPSRDPARVQPGFLSWHDFDRIIEKKQTEAKKFLVASEDRAGLLYTRPSHTIKVSPVPRAGRDTVYYSEDGVLYAFDRQSVAGSLVNPETGKPFSEEFVQQIRLIKEPRFGELEQVAEEAAGQVPEPIAGPSGASEGTSTVQPKKRKVSQYPDLFTKMRKYQFGSLCSGCETRMSEPKYSSEYEGNIVEFCSSECFDDFRFRK